MVFATSQLPPFGEPQDGLSNFVAAQNKLCGLPGSKSCASFWLPGTSGSEAVKQALLLAGVLLALRLQNQFAACEVAPALAGKAASSFAAA